MPARAAQRTQVVIRGAEGEGRVLSGDGSPFHDADGAAGDARRGTRPPRGDGAAASPARGRRAAARARRAVLARRGRFRAPHVPVRPVGLRQDVLARRRARAAAARDRPAARRARPELRLRAARGAAAGRGRRRRRRATRRRPARWPCGGPATASRFGFAELEPATQAAALRLDPVADREEYAELVALTDGGEPLSARAARAARARGRGRPAADRARAEPRPAPLGHLGGRGAKLDPARARTGRRALPRRRPRLARDEGGAGARLRGRARRALAAARRAQAGPDRHRRGAQRLPGAARGSADRDRDRVRGPDRGRGPQVRALPARLHAAAAEGARERALASATTCCSCG